MKNFELYEISNTVTTDLSLDVQIEQGTNDWQLDMSDGEVYFGRTADDAMANAGVTDQDQ